MYSVKQHTEAIERYATADKPISALTVTGPHELLYGEQEWFVRQYWWQRSEQAVGSTAPNVSAGDA